MCVPLRDQSGKVRYYLGAQLDITDLVDDCTALTTLRMIVERNNDQGFKPVKVGGAPKEALQGNEFEQLSEAFNPQELEKLIALRQRQQLQSEERDIYADLENGQRRHNSPSTTFTDLDYSFQLNGHGSAPPLGYYKTVGTWYGMRRGKFADSFSIFWSDRTRRSVSCLLRQICVYPEFYSPLC